MTKYTFMQMS